MLAKKSLPMTAIVVILILALASLGVSYGLWSDTLEINGVVHTGYVDAHMTLGEVDQGEYVPNGTNDDLEVELKDVAECTAELKPGPLGDAPDYDTPPDKVDISITNGYPSFHCYVEIDVANAGTIPIKVKPPSATNVVNTGGSNLTIETLACWTTDLQLEPGEDSVTAFPQCRVHIHIEQSATEKADYYFEGQFLAYQWNETVP
jgi:hypothetical protein